MENIDKLSIVDDIQVEYQKLYNECKPKHEQVKAELDEGLQILSTLKNTPLEKLEQEIKSSVDKLISPILLISENKVKRIYVSSLSVLKKIIDYSLITKEQSVQIIKALEKILFDSSEEIVLTKILETLSPLITTNFFDVTEDLVTSITKMSLKLFGYKFMTIKEPLTDLIKKLIDIVGGSFNETLQPTIKNKLEELAKIELENEKNKELNIELPKKEEETKNEETKNEENKNEENKNEDNKNEENKNDETKNEENKNEENKETTTEQEKKPELKDNNYFIEPKINLNEFESSETYKAIFYLFKTGCDLAEGLKIEDVYKGVHSKCLGYEILSLLILKTNDIFIYFPNIMSRINDSLNKELNKRFGKAYDYFTCIKITRLATILMKNLKIGFGLISFFIKYAENSSLSWQKQIGIEAIGELLSCSDFLNALFKNANDIYESLFTSFLKVCKEIIDYAKKKSLNMEIKKNNLDFDTIVNEKLINLSDIIFSFEKEPKVTIIHEVIYVELLQCFVLLFKSYENICTEQKYEKNIAVNILGFKEENLLNAIMGLCQLSIEEEIIEKFLNIILGIVKSLSIINLTEVRNLYLIEIEKLLGFSTNASMKTNDDININVMLEGKLIELVFKMFAEVIDVFDKEGFALLISCLHKIYFKILKSDQNLLINPNEEYEINVHIRFIEDCLKKYSKITDLQEILSSKIKSKLENQNSQNSENKLDENQENSKEATGNGEKNESGGGIFGTFKYVLGFAKKKDVNFEEEIAIEKQKKEMYKKLTDNLFQIFLTNTPNYSNDVLINLINALLENCKTLIDENKDNRVAFLNFNLTKFLELLLVNLNRFDLIWNSFVKVTEDIASRQLKIISHYSVDISALAIIFLLNLNKYNANKNNDFPQISQLKIFGALSGIASKNISQDINLNIIYNINFILTNGTFLFDTDGWNALFKILHSLILYQDEAQTENCFSIMEKIFGAKLNSISLENIPVIMEIIESFICYKKNELISKEALKMLTYLSSFFEQFQPYIYMTDFNKEEIKLNLIQKEFFSKKYKTKEERINYFDSVWKNIFNKLINLSCDERKEIRELVIDTFSKIFVKRCRSISPKSSLEIIKQNFFENFSKIYNIYDEKLKHNREVVQLKKAQVLKEKREEKAKREFVIGNFVALDLVQENEEKQENEIEEMIKENDTESEQKKQDELSWEGTLQHATISISEIIPAFIETNPNLGHEFYKENIFKLVGEKFSEVIKFISPRVAIDILKAVYLISYANKLLFYKYLNCFLGIYNELANFISSDYFLQAFPKMSVECNMVKEIINNLRLVFCEKEYHPIMNNKKNFNSLFNMIKALIVSSLNNEGNIAKKQTENLLKDEEAVFNFITEIQNLLLDYNKNINRIKNLNNENKNNNNDNKNKNNSLQNLGVSINLEEYEKELNNENKNNNEEEEDKVDIEEILVLFSEFLNSYLIIDLNNLHSEALCKKCLGLLVEYYSNELLPVSITKKTLPSVIKKCRDLILLRQKSELVSILFNAKEDFLKSSKNKSSKYSNFGNNFNNDYNNFITGEMNSELGISKSSTNDFEMKNTKFESKSNNINSLFIWQFASEKMIKILTYVVVQNNKDMNYNKYNIEDIWKVLIESYDMIFRQRESVFKNLKKNHKEWLSNSTSEMKISIINFIVNVLLPNSLHIPKEMQIKLLTLLDIGSSLEYESNNESTGSVTSSISKVCISNLFELCRFRTPESLKMEINDNNLNIEDYVKIKIKIAKMCTPILIKRCKEILKKFLADEIKSGSMPLSRSRLEDIKYVLDKLKKLEIYPEYNKVDDIDKPSEEKNEEEQEIMGYILKKKKSHLISLLPLLSEFITTKENEIKILVKEIFKIISSELGIK